MRLTFLGHAAFSIETSGKTVVTDPFSSEIGYLPLDQNADFVSISHQNPKWHSCLDDVRGDFEVIDGLPLIGNRVTRGEIAFGAARVWEKPGEGENAMVWLESEGIRVLHMGDCGLLPDDETIQHCGRVDVLLALSGGFPTLSLDDLLVFIEKLAPKIVIPMHFGVPGLRMPALSVAEIQRRFEVGNQVIHRGSRLDLTAGNLPLETVLHVLQPLRCAV